MSTPVIHVLAGPNGAGKSSLYATGLWPTTNLPFVNANLIAAERWPGAEAQHAYEASAAAAEERTRRMTSFESFVTETVFSHISKLDLIRDARAAGYIVTLHVVVVPENLAVARTANRVEYGGHFVPEDKVRSRHQRLWGLVRQAIDIANASIVYDNSRADPPLREIASYRDGQLVTTPQWPSWTPKEHMTD